MNEPTVYGRLVVIGAGFYWRAVGECPFCGGAHDYTGGSVAGDPREFLGLRLSNCAGSARWLALEEARA